MVRTAGTEQNGVSPREDFLIAERPGYLLHKAGLVLVEDVEKALGSVGMRIRYFFVLAALAGGPELSQQDLSRLLNLDPTTVVTVIDEMERDGHVERRRNPADRRRYNLILTESGREALATADRVATEVESAFFGALSGDERGVLRKMLGVLMAGRWPASVCSD
ncbi:MarR family winged helix-turn-helix transcriptional regulator [Streptomyces sp. NBC_01239]|uniref:MarR family winged helix-turn-helix transcriptional regulator n=1 Tax=Streptomyces sp. NBC_01239 TaxID=2903792 RepID=UPI002253A5CD|nr:MarR family winged helix-turn-helix transcriptional regulator [Streptomyces sp. NBC_01239]MCX4813998.1 MarR family winged helix-turn-helix transcriptional regulator [Streptomyces sp. NBC_01239]